MRITPVQIFLLSIGLIAVISATAWSQTPAPKCQDELSSLQKTKNTIIEEGGLWGLFERDQVLREKSSKAIQLDSKIQQLVWLLDYLCETVEGVPLNELATYLADNLKKKSKAEFRKELVILGKSESEINIWFAFSDISLKNKIRKLNPALLGNSIQKAFPLVHQYKQLAEAVGESPDTQHIESADNLFKKIEQLESSDAYLAQALHETSQVPHWDVDESVGGS